MSEGRRRGRERALENGEQGGWFVARRAYPLVHDPLGTGWRLVAQTCWIEKYDDLVAFTCSHIGPACILAKESRRRCEG